MQITKNLYFYLQLGRMKIRSFCGILVDWIVITTLKSGCLFIVQNFLILNLELIECAAFFFFKNICILTDLSITFVFLYFFIFYSKLLVLETGSTPLHLSLLPTSPDTHLLSGCDDGLYVFDIQISKNTQKRFRNDHHPSADLSVHVVKEKTLYCNLHGFSEMRRWRLCFQFTRKRTRKTPTGLLMD